MLEVHSISKSFSDMTVLEGISFSIGEGATALVGENGAGKTTLLSVIAGTVRPDSGSVRTDGSVGYLPQQPHFGRATVREMLGKSLPDHEIDAVLRLTGLTHIDRSMPAPALSGGEKTRLCLATILVRHPQPAVLLLDEPTNNLDMPGLQWLEDFIASYGGTVLFTSHDRTFLSRVARRIIELDRTGVTVYGGGYELYRERKDTLLRAYERRYAVQQRTIARVLDDIAEITRKARQGEREFGSDSPYERRKIRKSARQAVARRRKLEKFLDSKEHLDKPDERRIYPFRFSGEAHAGKFVIGMTHVTKRYGDRRVLSEASFSILGSQRVWLSGSNGAGKSTVIGLLTHGIVPDDGRIETGTGVSVGYFSQDIPLPRGGMTLQAYLSSYGAAPTDIHRYAAYFHMGQSDITAPLSSLSRGQRTKAEFIRLLMGHHHILILDEPTNHLDIGTRERIEDALAQYGGAVVVASHDRYFLERIGITRQLTVGGGTIRDAR